MLGALAWVAVIAATAQLLFALAWPDSLKPCSRFVLQAHYWAFMAQVFAYHAGIAMIPIALLALISRRRRLLIAASLLLLLGAGPELRSVLPRLGGVSAIDGSLKVMSINLMYGQGDEQALLAQITAESPDLIVFQEWTEEGAKRLRSGLAAAYPHTIETARTDAFGQAVFSRTPFLEPPREYPPVPGFAQPQIGVVVLVGDQPVRVENVHLLAPTGLGNFDEQRRCAAALAHWIDDSTRKDRPDVLIGDFNATSRTTIVRVLLRTGLRDAQSVSGWWRGSTWPRVGTLAWVPGIQLDHALCGPRVECVETRVGEDFGSDHRPVIVRLRCRGSRSE